MYELHKYTTLILANPLYLASIVDKTKTHRRCILGWDEIGRFLLLQHLVQFSHERSVIGSREATLLIQERENTNRLREEEILQSMHVTIITKY